MVGGVIVGNLRTISHGSRRDVRLLWCVDPRRPNDECAVYADPIEAKDVKPGDRIWWQGGTIYWTTADERIVEKELPKIGFSFDPRKDGHRAALSNQEGKSDG